MAKRKLSKDQKRRKRKAKQKSPLAKSIERTSPDARMRALFDKRYGSRCAKRSEDWYTVGSGRAAGQKVFVLTSATIEWVNRCFGAFDESELIGETYE